jgi:hypothetical protein
MFPAVPSKIIAAAIQLCAAAPPFTRSHPPTHCVLSLRNTALYRARGFFSRSHTSLAGCLIATTMAACPAPPGQAPKTYEVQWVNPYSGAFNNSEDNHCFVFTEIELKINPAIVCGSPDLSSHATTSSLFSSLHR